MVAVVFGARGNVGRHVAAGLRAAGEQVRVTSRSAEHSPIARLHRAVEVSIEESGLAWTFIRPGGSPPTRGESSAPHRPPGQPGNRPPTTRTVAVSGRSIEDVPIEIR